ncbi:MAG: CvpA family protein [Candidatus Omnitrophica bacterium]|nr:CvpA family protein [Candidatus Omnitrophota bacterium]
MLIDILKQFNWLDVFVLILMIRVVYVATTRGFISELFKLIGVLVAIYLSFHYYTLLADFIRSKLPVDERMPLQFLDFICFVALAGIGYSIFAIIRIMLFNLIKMDAVPRLQKWGGFLLGFFRAWLLSGLIVYTLSISSVEYLHKSVYSSYWGKSLFYAPVNTYTFIWESIMSKFMSGEKFNSTVNQASEAMSK